MSQISVLGKHGFVDVLDHDAGQVKGLECGHVTKDMHRKYTERILVQIPNEKARETT